jgi:hypothetical protein
MPDIVALWKPLSFRPVPRRPAPRTSAPDRADRCEAVEQLNQVGRQIRRLSLALTATAYDQHPAGGAVVQSRLMPETAARCFRHRSLRDRLDPTARLPAQCIPNLYRPEA